MIFFYRFLTIVLLTITGAIIGFGLSYTQAEKWKVTAQFEQPTIPNLGNYYSLLSMYHFLSTNNQEINEKKEATELVYDEFKRNLTSFDLLKFFLEQNEFVKLKAQIEKKTFQL